MASKQDRGGDGGRRASRAEAVRSAVDQAFQEAASQGVTAAETGRDRAQDIVDQLAQAAGRVRDIVDELRPPTGDDLRTLQETVAQLEKRVSELEQAQATPKPAARRSTGAAKKPKKSS
jgi:ABC-type transporter Mla subunit MlaD